MHQMPDGSQWRELIIQQAPELGLSITEEQARLFTVHAGELVRWNQKINLTAITDPIEMAVKHFLDSLVPSPYIPEHAAVLDMGTGGGFPGIPLKIIKPSLTITLIDATLKKINFVRQVIRASGLDRVTALHCRAQALRNDPAFTGRFDTVICRAFDSLDAFITLSHGLVRENGRLIAMKGRQTEDELPQLDDLKLDRGGRRVYARDLFSIDVHRYNLPVTGDHRSLVILSPTAS